MSSSLQAKMEAVPETGNEIKVRDKKMSQVFKRNMTGVRTINTAVLVLKNGESLTLVGALQHAAHATFSRPPSRDLFLVDECLLIALLYVHLTAA